MSRDAYQRHIETVRACRLCTSVVGPPIVGPCENARIVLVGQAPGPREGEIGHPFSWTAGRTMFRWFERLGVSETTFRARVHLGAVVRCFPGRSTAGGDRVPSRTEIDTCFPYVEREIELLGPGLVIAVGRLAIDRFVECKRLDEVIGRSFELDVGGHATDVVPLPHPSGRSTWTNRPQHRALLDRALALIGSHPAWTHTFGRRPAPAGSEDLEAPSIGASNRP